MMISPMLPTVAFMMPPMRGPSVRPSCSVAWPSVYASPRMARALTPKESVGSAFRKRSATAAIVPPIESP